MGLNHCRSPYSSSACQEPVAEAFLAHESIQQLTLTQMLVYSPTAQVQPCMAAAWSDLTSMVWPCQHGQPVEKYGALGMVQEQRCGRSKVW